MAAALASSFRSWWLPSVTAAGLTVIALVSRVPPPPAAAGRGGPGRVGRRRGGAPDRGTGTDALGSREVIETTHGTVAGYVLSVDSGYLNVLTDDHEFVVVLTTDVRARR